MKKRIASAILAGMMLASTAAVPAFAAAKVEDRKTCEAYIADITVDGKIDEAWAYANEYDVTVVKSSDADWYKSSMVSGKDYAAMTMKVLWNGNDKMYVLCEVEDANDNTAYNNSESWNGDSLEIQYELSNPTTKVAGTQWRFMSDGTRGSGKAAVYGYAKTEKGWLIEAEIDVSSVGGEWEYIAFDVQYNDNVTNQKLRQVCIAWCDTTNTSHSDASKMGQCLLSATKVADLKAAAEAKKPASTTETSPATFDAAIVLAAAAMISGAGVIVSKKKH